MTASHPRTPPDFGAVFEAAPSALLVLSPPDFTIVAANDAYLRATSLAREAIVGRPIFALFPDGAHDPPSDGPQLLRASLERAVATGRADAMPMSRWLVPRPATRGGGVEERWWSPCNVPVLGADGAVTGILHHLADVTGQVHAEAARREGEERHRLIVEGARDYAILTVGLDGRITSWSPGAEVVYGWPAAEAVGQPLAMTFTEEDRAARAPEHELAQAAAEGLAPDVRWHLRRDQRRIFIDGVTRALHDGSGRVREFLKIGQDVTPRRELDEALRASETRYRILVDNLRDYVIALLDPEGRITEWTAGAERVTGHAARDVIGRSIAVIYPPEELAKGVLEDELREAAQHGRAEREGWRMRRNGERFWANEIATAVHDGHGRLVCFSKISRDLTERRAAEESRERARVEMEREILRRELSAAEESERRRLARELHDQLGQHLTAFALGLTEARRLFDAGASPAGRLGQLEALAQLMTRDARHLALELRPPELDDLGLASAIDTYVSQWSDRYGVHTDVEVLGLEPDTPLPGDVGTTVYRVAQEALTNVAKHAQATQVSVLLDGSADELRLVVEDDGRGFDVAASEPRVRAERRLGLASMRERAALVGGTVEVESTPGAGTAVYLRVPLGGP